MSDCLICYGPIVPEINYYYYYIIIIGKLQKVVEFYRFHMFFCVTEWPDQSFVCGFHECPLRNTMLQAAEDNTWNTEFQRGMEAECKIPDWTVCRF